MKQLILLSCLIGIISGCASLKSEPMSPTCQKLRRKMAYLKHTPANAPPEEYYQLRQIAKEYDCPL